MKKVFAKWSQQFIKLAQELSLKIIDAEIETDCDFHEEIVSYEEWIEQQNEKPVEQQLLLALLNYKKSME